MPPDTGGTHHALIIEDNRDLGRLFSDLLNVLGCTADVVSSAQAGIEQALLNPPDVVFCDLRLPGDSDGFDVARSLRADARTRHACLIAVTGVDTAWIRSTALEAGFDDVLGKPVKFAQVQAVLAALQNRPAHADTTVMRKPLDGTAAPCWTTER